MPHAVVAETLAGLELGEPRMEGGLAVVPLLEPRAGGRAPAPDFELGAEYLGEGLLEVTEVPGGERVPELRFRNHADRDLLLLEGEEILGALQNRVLNASVLVGAGSEGSLPVSCVEQGRWSRQTRTFRPSGNVMTPRQRSRLSRSVSRSLERGLSFRSDQMDVWRSIEEMEAALGTASLTGAMADAFREKATSLEETAARFVPSGSQVGWVVLVGGKPVALDVLSSPEAFGSLQGRLLRSYVMEAHLSGGPGVAAAAASAAARGFLEEVSRAEARGGPSPGRGEDVRLHGDRVLGSALVVDGGLVHLGAFPADGGAAP